jgi:phospho-N-acetylmuramoyl-pentapeptide-transferase
MFYYFLYPLREIFFGFNVFKYITFRVAGSTITAFIISILLGPLVIRYLTYLKIGQYIRKEEIPALYDLHKSKEGTPTMGGVLILSAILFSTFLWADLSNIYVQWTMLVTLFLGMVGFADDYIKLVKKRSLGLRPMTKLFWQIIIALALGVKVFCDPEISTNLDIPFFKNLIINLGIFYILWVVVVIVGCSNAVNLTDGLDGLAIGCVIMIALAYVGFSYVSGHSRFSEYLNIHYIPGTGELSVFCAALIGAGLGFLWFNSYPATVFMGDTGSLALGGAIGTIAVFIKKELLLLLVGGIFVIEAVSVILQVASFRLRGKRIFLMSPLHHHFQLLGWSESKITIRFWIVGVILALLSLATLKLR